ncbi:uncharacterized protein K452DRAFT_256661 [Aplosporella prunicola CBS 121167]|uniref:FAD-binding domain-containing protein n=1 Tax=Aplosporella prunicola CBS 121167 TaxID=1176127 RepID=A0A6A6B5A4_9PEZI|nr:uncharacterized protein K452DRAFT_256661 [Aplosporella prunicola CBS 121167]KAF2138404.1 hypothetical protein K452DRAFT_256661 [Aplosporella prunicola CBS 121167]
MVSDNMVHTSVIIVGAGATGLLIAQGFKKIGVDCIVLEKKESLLPPGHRDWNMGAHWGFQLLEQLISEEARKKLPQVEVDPHVPIKAEDVCKFHNAATGELIATVPVYSMHRLQRQKLRNLLADGIDIRFNKSFVNMEMIDVPGMGSNRSVAARFEDGTTIVGKIIIGADGTRSSVRRSLLGEKQSAVRPLPWVATWAQAKYTVEQAVYLRKWHNLYSCSVHPQGFFSTLGLQDIPDPQRPEDWVFWFYITWPLESAKDAASWDNAARLRHFKEIAKDWADPMKSAVGWLSDDHYVWHAQFAEWDPEEKGHRWNNFDGRVTLAGDAAHTMTWSRGQGLNNGFEDAANLVKAIGAFLGRDGNEGKQKESIDTYEAEMIPRGGRETRVSSITTTSVNNWETFMESPVVKMGLKKTPV